MSKKPKTQCLICKNKNLIEILNLGKTALANNLIPFKFRNIKEKQFPLILCYCKNCKHVQLKNIVNPKLMFDNYLYISSASSTLKKHLSNIPKKINNVKKISKNDLVIDIGSNDGSLLSGYKKFRAKRIGIEPAKNLKKYYKNSGIMNINEYFNISLANRIKHKYGKAKVITATNVFPHIQNLHDFCKSLKIVMDKKGIFVFEAHYLLNLIKDVAFDTIYHEHVSYWSISAAQNLFSKYDLEIFKVDKLNIHHGQIRCWICHKSAMKKDKKLNGYFKLEKQKGKIDIRGLEKFKNRVLKNKMKFKSVIQNLKKRNLKIVGYGAPAKASTLISYLNLTTKDISYIVDINPLKQNCFVPGNRIPILSTEKIYIDKPNYLINFAWNFIDEIVKQNKIFLKNGGKIINPIPKFKIINKKY
jgi:hypothetical protein